MEDYVTFEQAQRLKELGFDWKCLYWYHPNEDDKTKRFRMSTEMNHNFYKRGISAPSLSLAQKWLREVKGIDAIVLRYADDYDYKVYSKNMVSVTEELFENYEKALSAAIDEALELLK